MKKSVCLICLLVLSGCAVIKKDKEEFKKISHDLINEAFEESPPLQEDVI